MRALSLVEKGWAAARQVSIHLSQDDWRVEHVVKGRIPREVLEIVTPYPRMKISSVWRQWYEIIVWMKMLKGLLDGAWQLVLVDNQRRLAWVQRSVPFLAARTVLVEEVPGKAPRLVRQGHAIDLPTLLK